MGIGLNGNTAHYYTAASPASACGITIGKMNNSFLTVTVCDRSYWRVLWHRDGPAGLARDKTVNLKGMTTKHPARYELLL